MVSGGGGGGCGAKTKPLSSAAAAAGAECELEVPSLRFGNRRFEFGAARKRFEARACGRQWRRRRVCVVVGKGLTSTHRLLA